MARRSSRSRDTIERRGEAYFPSSGTLPPAQERVLTDVDELAEIRRPRPALPTWEAVYQSTIKRARKLPQIFSVVKQPRRAFSRQLGRYNPRALLLEVRVPQRVRFCLQRKQRREVLFAWKRAGFRGSAPKRFYRRSQNSQYRC